MPSSLTHLFSRKPKQNPYQSPQHHHHHHLHQHSLHHPSLAVPPPPPPTNSLRPVSPILASNFLAEARIASNRDPVTGRPASMPPGQGRACAADEVRVAQQYDGQRDVAEKGQAMGNSGMGKRGEGGTGNRKENGNGSASASARGTVGGSGEHYAPQGEWVGEYYSGGRERAAG